MEFIDLKEQYRRYQREIDERMGAVIRHGQFIMGPEIRELESELSAFVGVKHCITVASGTDSLEIALRAIGVGAGDEVITVPFSWISSAEVIGLVGAKPVFVDIEVNTYNLDVNQVEAAITPRTKAIIAVSLFGQMADFEAINKVASRYGIIVIEDAAQSFGATRDGRRSCGVSHIGSTSFFPAKPLGCYGDGGALFTDDPELSERMQAIRSHGGLKRHHHPYLGMNGRFDTLQAAVLLAKLPFFGAEIRARAGVGARYTELLADCCAAPDIASGNSHIYSQYTIRVSNRDAVGCSLKAIGIPTAVYYPKCIHEQPVFSYLNCPLGSFPNAEKASREVISLPMHPFLTKDDQDLVVAAVRAVAVSTQ